jgi:hypothetical protein
MKGFMPRDSSASPMSHYTPAELEESVGVSDWGG